MRLRGAWIIGTDTEVGKTFVMASFLRWLRVHKGTVLPMKPVQTGAVESVDGMRAPDLDYVLQESHFVVEQDMYSLMAPYMYKPACSPHLAGRQESRYPSIEKIVENATILGGKSDFLLIEGSGGLLVPLNEEETLLDLIKALPLPILLVARGGLGTINHTLLSVSLLLHSGLHVAGIIINDAEGYNDNFIRQDNPKTIQSFSKIPILADIMHGASINEREHQAMWNAVAY